MKKIVLLVVAFMFLPATSFSEDGNWRELCEGYAGLAATVMGKRLDGVPMQAMVKAVIKDGSVDQDIERMVTEAYDSPRFTTEEHKRRAVEEFRDRWYLLCYKAAKAAGRQ